MGLPKGSKLSAEARANVIQGLIGRKLSDETKQKIRLSNIGRKHSAESKDKMRLAHLGIKRPWFESENHPLWKADNVGNKALHRWVRKNFPAPKECEKCKQIKRLDLANKTGVYNREFKNWFYLCHKCHMHYDGVVDNLWYNKLKVK